jgi:hypothetical protein
MSIIISIIALIISAVSAYYTIFRNFEELGVVIIKSTHIELDRDKSHVTYASPFTILMTNTGNRPVSVVGVQALVQQSPTPFDEGSTCLPSDTLGQIRFNTSLEPTLIKEGDIVKLDVDLRTGFAKPKGTANTTYELVPTPAWFSKKSPYYARFCLEFRLVTPSTSVKTKPIAVPSVHVNIEGESPTFSELSLQHQILLSRSVQIADPNHPFWRGWAVN